MYRNPYFVLKVSLASVLLTSGVLFVNGANLLVSIFVALPQLPFVLAISYFELKHKTSIINFPILLSSSAIGAYVGSLFGVLGVIREIDNSIKDGDLIGAAIGNSIAGFLTMSFVGVVAGLVIHFSQTPNK
ncbi:hypothetical protein [Pseudoalteromonas ruthenica]|uniref:Uncharacterized protein n=1 Tax=Pseudoalteromonas ruthenica TaxID=151081 RepID=A0A0F4PWJ9_9GAMM|nr:hypothetical protein [Pseudoalteromonas ruthenica]KJY99155.1 hypothetical protein TW76_05665 [Pseudoalteromonas ruthenica]KJY99802.1 hypothetical protein TW72_09230 [Pseudoalteromonas ruthenica]TMO88324.1 hypothetical protein CWC12_09105 [Pseudoalteromonas ruthenica]TMO92994.1 hypothetical protein CWC13_07625 [Pseudoalteromonas ruthenica]TMP00516.1 hypothetical protein CWC07_04730 [Pseudoalteromonas ruthenica]